MEMEEYLDEVNELAEELERDGHVNALERLSLSVIAVCSARDWDVADMSCEASSEDYRDTVPP